MIEESFAAGDSFMHKLDPRVKILVACIFSIIIGISDRLPAIIPALIIALIVLFLSRLSIESVCFRLIIVNGFLLLIWVFIPFTMEGDPVFSLGPLIASKQGIIYCLTITVKTNSIICILIAMLSTMPVFTLGKAMRRLYMPAKMVHLFLFTYRYIHVIHREYLRLMSALKIRGFRPATNMHTYKTYAYLVGMLFVKSHDRAERVKVAMICRGFKGQFYDLSEFSMKAADVAVMILAIVVVTFIGLLQWTKIIY